MSNKKYLAEKFAHKLSNLAGRPPEDGEVIAYGLEYLVSTITGLALMLFTGIILRMLPETLAIIFCWTAMRIFAGGAHCTALWRCVIVNLLGMIAVLMLTRMITYLIPAGCWVLASILWALLAVALWAPKNSERPFPDPVQRSIRRRQALVMVILLGSVLTVLVFVSDGTGNLLATAGATGLAAGGGMLSDPAFRMIKIVDSKLFSIRGKGGEI